MGILAELFTDGDQILGSAERARYEREDALFRKQRYQEWDESKHPRDGGKFAPKEGGGVESDYQSAKDAYRSAKARHAAEPSEENKSALEAARKGMNDAALAVSAARSPAKEPVKKAKPSKKSPVPTGSKLVAKVSDIAAALQDSDETSPTTRGSRYGSSKVFIGAVWDKFHEEHPEVSRDEFNRDLIDANRRGDLQLTRADLVQAMHPDDVANSEIGNGEFHFIRTDSAKYEKKGERWITLNGNSGEDGNGGTPVKIDGEGAIVAGPSGLADKGVKSLKDFGNGGKEKTAGDAPPEQSNPAAKPQAKPSRFKGLPAAHRILAEGLWDEHLERNPGASREEFEDFLLSPKAALKHPGAQITTGELPEAQAPIPAAAAKPKRNPSDNLWPYAARDFEPDAPPKEQPAQVSPPPAAQPQPTDDRRLGMKLGDLDSQPGDEDQLDVIAKQAEAAKALRKANKASLFESFKGWFQSLMKQPIQEDFGTGSLGKIRSVMAKSLHAKRGQQERYQMQAFNRFLGEMQRYGKDEKWITLNGGSGDGGNGGVPVKVDGKGNIVAGPAGIAKKLGESKKPEAPKEPEKEPPSRASSKDQLTENVARAAKDYEIDEDDLHDALEDVWEETRKRVSEREAAKEAIRKATGITAQDIARLDNNGLDYASDPKKVAEQFPALAGKLASLDVYASEHASSYPELELGDDSEDQVANIIDRIREGKQSPPPKHDADLIDEAAQLVHSARVWRMNNPVHDDAEAIPFGKQGQVIRYALKRWYMKDANGMEHAADGKFGSGGGKARSLFDDHEPTPEKKKATGEFHDGDKRVQKKLLSGLDSAPGQKDLFDVDGVAEKPKARSESDARNSANDWLKSEERKNLNMTAGGTHVAKIDKEKLKPWHDAVRSRYDQQISQATPLSSGMNVPQYRGHFKVGDIAVSKDKTRVGQVVELKNQTGGGAWGTSKLHTQKSVGVQWFDTREKEEIHPDGGIIPVGVAYERAP